MAAETILILRESGMGKSTSLRNLNPKETFIISTTSKPLPWRGWKKNYTEFNPKTLTGNRIQMYNSNKLSQLLKFISVKMPHIKNIVCDDLQYTMGFEFMDRRNEKGYDKFNSIGGDFTDLLRTADQLRDDIHLIFTAHSENTGDAMNPHWTLKTIGKMVNEKITPEGLFTYVFYALCEEGDNGMEYIFLTNSDGDHVAKTPLGMFKDKKIPNDVAEILKVIDDYNNGDDDKYESGK